MLAKDIFKGGILRLNKRTTFGDFLECFGDIIAGFARIAQTVNMFADYFDDLRIEVSRVEARMIVKVGSRL